MFLSVVRRGAAAAATASVRGDVRHRMGGRGGLRRRGGVTASAAAEGGPAFKQSVLESRPRVSRNRG